MDNKLAIKLKIAERVYPLRIDRDEEQKFREAAKLINEKLAIYRKHFTTSDGQDLLAMVSLHLATRQVESGENLSTEAILRDLKELTNDIESFIIENNDL